MAVMQGGQVQAGSDRRDLRFTRKGYYDFAVQGGAIGSVNLVDEGGHSIDLPDNLIITSATIQTLTVPTSGGAATIAVGSSQSGKSAVILAATTFNSSPFNAIDAVTAAAAVASASALVTAAQTLQVTIATAALTAGKFTVIIHGTLGD